MEPITDIPKISVSWLDSFGYCEYQFYLKHVIGIKVKPSKEMLLGTKRHIILEIEHKEKATVKLSVRNAMKWAEKEKVKLTTRELWVEGTKLQGRIDELQIYPDRIMVIDDKPTTYPWDNHKKQIWGYCLAFEEQYNPSFPIYSILRNRDTQEIVWRELLTNQHRELVSADISQMFEILEGTRVAELTENKKKCMACGLRIKCCAY
jgi:hypothetical protein